MKKVLSLTGLVHALTVASVTAAQTRGTAPVRLSETDSALATFGQFMAGLQPDRSVGST